VEQEHKILQQHIAVENSRLDRIEEKIDRLAETVISLARAEEKLIALENDKKFLMTRMMKNEERIDLVEKKVDETTVTVAVINRLFWIAISVTSAAFVGQYFIR
jgi:vacuolar-type H+-ATPase subunit E/Vma4